MRLFRCTHPVQLTRLKRMSCFGSEKIMTSSSYLAAYIVRRFKVKQFRLMSQIPLEGVLEIVKAPLTKDNQVKTCGWVLTLDITAL